MVNLHCNWENNCLSFTIWYPFFIIYQFTAGGFFYMKIVKKNLSSWNMTKITISVQKLKISGEIWSTLYLIGWFYVPSRIVHSYCDIKMLYVKCYEFRFLGAQCRWNEGSLMWKRLSRHGTPIFKVSSERPATLTSKRRTFGERAITM